MATERKKPAILIVDDDRNTREGLQRALKFRYDVRLAADAKMAMDEMAYGDVEIMLTDVRMPGMNGLELLKTVRTKYPKTICILLTAYGSVETAVEAMKQGAYDFLTKPVNLDHLDAVLDRAFQSKALEEKNRKLEDENRLLGQQLDKKYGMESIIGNAEAMQPVFEVIRAAAPTLATVLITGPSGTGKELVAKAIHRLSTR